MIDVGGESTRPGAAYVSEQEELDRVVPVIEQLSQKLDVMISIDTYKPAVMAAACQADSRPTRWTGSESSNNRLAAASNSTLAWILNQKGKKQK